jgi:hypothetical protein
MPPRIVRNKGKSSHLPMYAHLSELKPSSKEYVALLSLAMIDGTFQTLEQEDPVYDERGYVREGQHREAAITLLTTNEEKIA